MSSSVIAKFQISTVEHQGYRNYETDKPQTTGVKVNMSPVYKPKDKNHENYKFWEASPSGQCWLQIQNPNAFDFFQPGQEQYVIFVDAENGKEGLVSALETMLATLKAEQAPVELEVGEKPAE
jgi:hypothetical protein